MLDINALPGLGRLEYTQDRLCNENILPSLLEEEGCEKFVLYLGRTYLQDARTGFIAASELKIGRAKFLTAIMRGRNQGGVDFRVHAEIVFSNNKGTHESEKFVTKYYLHRNKPGTQGQTEMYDFLDDEIPGILSTVVAEMQKFTDFDVLDCIDYQNQIKVPVKYNNIQRTRYSKTPIVSKQVLNKFISFGGPNEMV